MLPCLKRSLMRKWFSFTLFLEGEKFWPRQDLAQKTIHGIRGWVLAVRVWAQDTLDQHHVGVL